ncbi:MAG: 5-oxoprolinase subunit PxpB [candidate division NC10 bacterium]|nr:5-oxoprolinase subunit PxpB [candidate division NC10 bacterium]
MKVLGGTPGMQPGGLRFLPAGERGLVVEFGNEVSLEINAQVRALAFALAAERIPGLVEVVPTYRSIGLEYDPLTLSFDEVEQRVREVATRIDPRVLPAPKLVRIPTVYGGIYGPDLPFVAEHAGLGEAEAIRLHSQPTYHVYMIGFTPGYTYLGGLPERLHTPRLQSPRLKVPKGSVGIGGSQTGIYPVESPGGWRIIGRTHLTLFDPAREVPTPILPGDTVQFVPITEDEYLRAATGERVSRQPGTERRETGHRRPTPVPGLPSPVPGQPAIEVLRPGLLTTVQDRGRIGYQKFGVPASGAVDEIALRVGNILVGNAQGAAGMEITALGPQLRFLADAIVALTGAEVDADLDGKPVPWYQSFLVRAGQVLDVRTCIRGLRAYLAVAGGIDVPVLLGSRSTCLVAGFGGFHGRALAAGDLLRVGAPEGPLTSLSGREVPGEWRPHHESPATLRVVLGPQEDAFSEEGRRAFLEAVYRVSPHADRMGCRLDGPVIAHRDSADILSDWIPPGGVQVPGDGKPIILLADRQTTGGYPKIATVIGADISLVAQSRPGDALRFRAISVKEARAIAREVEAALAALPARLLIAESWTYGAELGEVPGEIPLAVVGAPPRAVPSRVQPRGATAVASPLPAQVVKVLGSPGDAIVAGQPLVVLMAMKMEHSVVAPLAGRIAAIRVREGDVVGAGDLLVTIEPAADAGSRVRGGER